MIETRPTYRSGPVGVSTLGVRRFLTNRKCNIYFFHIGDVDRQCRTMYENYPTTPVVDCRTVPRSTNEDPGHRYLIPAGRRRRFRGGLIPRRTATHDVFVASHRSSSRRRRREARCLEPRVSRRGRSGTRFLSADAVSRVSYSDRGNRNERKYIFSSKFGELPVFLLYSTADPPRSRL